MLNTLNTNSYKKSKKEIFIISLVLVCLFFVFVFSGVGFSHNAQSSTKILFSTVDNNGSNASTAVAGSSVNVPYGYEYGTGSITKTFYWYVNGAPSTEVQLMTGDWINMWLVYDSGPLAGTVVPCSNVTLVGSSTTEPLATYTWTGLFDPTETNSNAGQAYTVDYTYNIQLQNGTVATVSGYDNSAALTQSTPSASLTNYVVTTDPSTYL